MGGADGAIAGQSLRLLKESLLYLGLHAPSPAIRPPTQPPSLFFMSLRLHHCTTVLLAPVSPAVNHVVVVESLPILALSCRRPIEPLMSAHVLHPWLHRRHKVSSAPCLDSGWSHENAA